MIKFRVQDSIAKQEVRSAIELQIVLKIYETLRRCIYLLEFVVFDNFLIKLVNIDV